MPAPSPAPQWYRDSKNVFWLWLAIAVLTLLTLASGLIALWQFQAAEAMRTANLEAVEAFNEPPQPDGSQTTEAQLNNTEFCWTDTTCAQLEGLAATLKPQAGQMVNADKPTSFSVGVKQGMVHIAPQGVAGMLNDSIFNYPQSALRNMTVDLSPYKGKNVLSIDGNIKVLFWIPFNMLASMSVNQDTNTLNLKVEKITVLKFIPALWAIKFDPLNLDKLLPLPKNNHLSIHQNTIAIKPFGLFPPPRLSGDMKHVRLDSKHVHLAFSDQSNSTMPAGTSIYLNGGRMQFGTLSMNPVDIAITDQTKNNAFRFRLSQYKQLLSNSQIELDKYNRVTVSMPDAK